jgi:nucleotide-binding universal stress UspA family protein
MKDWDIKTIVLGYDGSEGAKQAAELAIALARLSNARIIAITAFHGHSDALSEFAARNSVKAQALTDEIMLMLGTAGVKAEPIVLEGQAPEALLRAAESHDADLIVVGRRGHGLTAGLLLGSTSEYVVRRAKVPVLVAH